MVYGAFVGLKFIDMSLPAGVRKSGGSDIVGPFRRLKQSTYAWMLTARRRDNHWATSMFLSINTLWKVCHHNDKAWEDRLPVEGIRLEPALQDRVLDDQVHRNWARKPHLIVAYCYPLDQPLPLLPYIHPRLAGFFASSQSAFHSFTFFLCSSKSEDSSESKALPTWGCSSRPQD